jgi:hypothetical protein
MHKFTRDAETSKKVLNELVDRHELMSAAIDDALAEVIIAIDKGEISSGCTRFTLVEINPGRRGPRAVGT